MKARILALLVDIIVLGDITHGVSVGAVCRVRKSEVGGEKSLLGLGEEGEGEEVEMSVKVVSIRMNAWIVF